MKLNRILLLPLLLILATNLFGQNVGGGLSIAGVASQIDGDAWGGYKKLGYCLGGFAWYDFNDRWSLSPEITLGNRGSRELEKGYGQINLNFIDVPVLVRFRAIGDVDGQSLLLEAGPSANILYSAKSGFSDLKQNITPSLKKFGASVNLGLIWFVNPKIGITGRWTSSFTNLNGLGVRPWLTTYFFSFGAKIAFK